MPACAFCGRNPTADYALTACSGSPEGAAAWRREVPHVCSRCHKALEDAGSAGRRFKATGERWWLGHSVGRLLSPGGPSASWPGPNHAHQSQAVMSVVT